MRYAVANNARTRLTATLLATHDIIHVESTSAFPLAEYPYLVSINDEILEVKPTSSTTFAVLNRGCEGTTPDQAGYRSQWRIGSLRAHTKEFSMR